MEKWIPLTDYIGIYEISDKGRVRRIKTSSGAQAGHMMTTSKAGHYCQVNVSKNGNHRCLLVHRLVAQHFIPNPDNLPAVNHKDGNKANNSANNLEWVTYHQNTQHANRNGMLAHGEHHGMAKLTDDIVAEIRRLYAMGDISQRALGIKFDVCESTIQQIVSRKIWIHVP